MIVFQWISNGDKSFKPSLFNCINNLSPFAFLQIPILAVIHPSCRFALSSKDMELSDYDRRTALHVSAAEGEQLSSSHLSYSPSISQRSLILITASSNH